MEFKDKDKARIIGNGKGWDGKIGSMAHYFKAGDEVEVTVSADDKDEKSGTVTHFCRDLKGGGYFVEAVHLEKI